MVHMVLANVLNKIAAVNHSMTSLPAAVDQNPSTQPLDAMCTSKMRRNVLACNLGTACPRVTIANPFAICCRAA